MNRMFRLIALAAFCTLIIPASHSYGMLTTSSATDFGTTIGDTIASHKLAIVATAAAGVGYYAYHKATTAQKNYRKSLHSDWKHVDEVPLEDIVLKDVPVKGTRLLDVFKNCMQEGTWLWGTATSAHQVEGDCDNNQWALFAREGRTLKTGDLKQKEKIVEPAGNACEFEKRYESDADLMLEIGTNAHRFSVEMSKVMPKKGIINEAALEHYDNVCAALCARGMRPAITLYHYTEPIWFYEEGGFENAENIKYFVAFCRATAEKLQKYNPLWFTFNAAEGHAAQGWLKGMKPPAKENQYKLMAQVLFNLLQAHVLTYMAIHEVDPNAQVGILKNIMQLDPWRIWHPLDNFAASTGNKLVNDSLYNFFQTGDFEVYVPFKVSFKEQSKELKELIKQGNHALDFVGLNYYCHNYMKNLKTIAEPDETLEPHTNNPRYPIYGEGLERALYEISDRMAKPCGDIPIYVTENGVAANNDEEGNKIRNLHNRRTMYSLAKAIANGVDVRGYFHWSLMDNYEWGMYGKNYGIFEVQRKNNLQRVLKPGATFLVNLMKKSSGNKKTLRFV